MNTKTKTTRKLLGGAAAATMAALVLAPASGWLVRTELLFASSGPFGQAAAFLHPDKFSGENLARDAARISAQNPDDLGLQMAARQREMPVLPDNQSSAGTRRAHALFPLREKFGSSPALHATILRFLSQDSVKIAERPEVAILKNEPFKPSDEKSDTNANRPEDLAAWEQSASAGEKLDPNNAYFPLMHAVGLFAAHRDNEALEAVRRAGEKTFYNEYTTEETEGQWRLDEAAHGKSGFVAEMAVSAAQLLPHYAPMRSVARLAAVDAIQAEQAGDEERGFQNRMALTRISGLMRQGSKTFIGVLVGRAIGYMAWTRPGAALPLPKVKNASDRAAQDKRVQENLDRYCAYLTKIGHGEAVPEVQWENAASDKYRKLWTKADNLPNNYWNFWGTSRAIFRLIGFWAAGLGLLTNLFSVLVLGGLFTVLARNARIREGLPMSKAARTGMLSAFGLPAYGFLVAQTWPETPALVLLAVGSAALGLGIFKAAQIGMKVAASANSNEFQAAAPAPKTSISAFWKTFALTALIIAGFGITGSVGMVQTMQSGRELLGFDVGSPHVAPLLLGLLGMAVSSLVSLLLLIGLVIASRVKRVPVSVGVVRGFRRFALPTACVLVFLYAGVVCQTVREEARASAAMREIVSQGEVKYFSRLVGEPLVPTAQEAVNEAKDNKTK